MTAFHAEFSHHTAYVNGVRLHYVMGGRGDPLVLLHGWPQTWYEWRKIMPTLAAHYTVIAPDLRGTGDSDKPTTGYDTGTVAAEIHELVSQLELGSINLVGHDVGGMVAYAYASLYPDDVRRLVIIEILLPGLGLEELEVEKRIWHFSFHAVPDLPEALIAGKERTYLSWFYRNFAYNPDAISEADVDEYVRCYSTPGALRAGFQHYRAFPEDARLNKEFAKTKLSVPVLALGGDRSVGDLLLHSLHDVVADVRGEVIERCGHWVAEERPEVLAATVLNFFQEE